MCSNRSGCQILHCKSVTHCINIVSTFVNWSNYAPPRWVRKAYGLLLLPEITYFSSSASEQLLPIKESINTNIFYLGNLVSKFIQVLPLIDLVWCYIIFICYWHIVFGVWCRRINSNLFPNWFQKCHLHLLLSYRFCSMILHNQSKFILQFISKLLIDWLVRFFCIFSIQGFNWYLFIPSVFSLLDSSQYL